LSSVGGGGGGAAAQRINQSSKGTIDSTPRDLYIPAFRLSKGLILSRICSSRILVRYHHNWITDAQQTRRTGGREKMGQENEVIAASIAELVYSRQSQLAMN
jgi:hypothetical protein